MKIIRYLPLIMVLMLLAGLSLPAANIHARNSDQPEDDEFYDALVIMAVNHGMMAGDDELTNLVGLRDHIYDHYNKLIADPQNKDQKDALEKQRDKLRNQLNNSIRVKSGTEMLIKFLDMFTGGDSVDDYRSRFTDADPVQVISGQKNDSTEDDEYDPKTDYFNVMYSHIMTDFPSFIDMCLDIDIMQSYPSLAPSISDASDWSYSSSLVNASTGGITSQPGDDGGSSADFWDPGDTDSQLSDSTAPIGGGDDSNSPTDTIDIHKSIRFINNGFEAVTVVVESYQPAPGLSPAISSASTVVFPESNSSAYLDLPQGTYTFCYYWQLDIDYNNDDYFDYHHKTTSAVTLNENSSSIPESAVTVALNPDSTVSNPNGKCGENFTANLSNGNLTPAEVANAGTHTYVFTCEGHEWCEGEVDIFTFNISFGEASFTLTGEGENDYFVRVGENQYTWTGSDGDVYTLAFTMDGFRYYNDALGTTLYYTLEDTSSVNPAPVDQNSVGLNDSGLTPEQAANAGTHNYQCNVPGYGGYPEVMTITFSTDSAKILTKNWTFLDNVANINLISQNKYSLCYYGICDIYITFTAAGFTQFDSYTNKTDLNCLLQD